MTSYFEYNDNKTRKTSSTNTGYEIIDIPDVMVTEYQHREIGYAWARHSDGTMSPVYYNRPAGVERQGGARPRQGPPSSEDRHGWYCPCVDCRSDRGEE